MRNKLGFKDSVNCYRTFNGARFIAWGSSSSAVRAKIYRENGVVCRRVSGELFILPDDDVRGGAGIQLFHVQDVQP